MTEALQSVAEAQASVAIPTQVQILPPAPAAAFGGYTAPVPSNFTLSPEGDGTQRLPWARSSDDQGPGGSYGGLFSVMLGGRTARDATGGGNAVANMATSHAIIWTLLQNAAHQILGDRGLTLSARPDYTALGLTAEEGRRLSNAIEREWQKYVSNPRSCDYNGRFNLHQLALANLFQALMFGESFTGLEWRRRKNDKYFTKCHLLDVAQIASDLTLTRAGGRHIFRGIIFDKEGLLWGYAVRDVPIGSLVTAPMWKEIPAFTPWGRTRLFQTFAQYNDVRMVRGLTPLIASLTPAKENELLQMYNLQAALLAASNIVSVKSDLPESQAMRAFQVDAGGEHRNVLHDWVRAKAERYGPDGDGEDISLKPGKVAHLLPFESIEAHHLNTQANNFAAQNDSQIRRAAKAFGDSAENVSGDYSRVNFSASRAANYLPNLIVKRRRADICERFYAEIYAGFLEECVERRVIELPDSAPDFNAFKAEYTSAKWLGPAALSVDILKQTTADLLRLENGLVSFTDILSEQGVDFEAHVEQLRHEREILKELELDHPFFVGTTQTRVDIKEDEKAPESEEKPDDKSKDKPTGNVTPARNRRAPKSETMARIQELSAIAATEDEI